MGQKEEKKYFSEASSALVALQKNIHWKPGKDTQHLRKRKEMGHLPEYSSLEDYNNLIGQLVKNASNIVYLYEYKMERYYAVRGNIQDADWIVIFSKDGIMETAFPLIVINDYIKNRGFIPLGSIEEVVGWEKKKDY